MGTCLYSFLHCESYIDMLGVTGLAVFVKPEQLALSMLPESKGVIDIVYPKGGLETVTLDDLL